MSKTKHRFEKKSAFIRGFFDELMKVAQGFEDLAPVPVSEQVQNRIYRSGTGFQRAQRAKEIKQMTMAAPLEKTAQDEDDEDLSQQGMYAQILRVMQRLGVKADPETVMRLNRLARTIPHETSTVQPR